MGIFLKLTTKPSKYFVKMDCMYSDFVPSFPFFAFEEGRLVGGAMPIFINCLRWPSWYPFCKQAEVLGVLSETQVVYQITFKIGFITADVVMLVAMVDRLLEDGTYLTVLASAPPGIDGQQWLGITVPPCKTMVREVVDAAVLKCKPDRLDGGQLTFYIEGPEEIGIEWVAKLYWKTCCTKVVPLIAKQLPHFRGSDADRDYQEGGVLRRLLPAMVRIEANMRTYIASLQR
eukprot:NODE_3133_length_825_cov_268.007792.p2 GENE.NODE_3133_length_825_cov_268.007792~~NODE_3133_length_825_cov_268.007792.p2  ORF type:complete len:231 (+),score=86.41 NODE_3133_length_825_cov_268.007792:3-695(+)